MTIELSRTPFPITYRELWLPKSIKGNAILPSSKYNGQELTLTGAQKRTTCDGVRFTGSATSNINCGAIHNAAVKLWIRFRFKLDTPHASGDAGKYLFAKRIGDNDFLRVRLDPTNGSLYFENRTSSVFRFQIQWTAWDTWNDNQWYEVLASMSSVNGARLRVDNGVARTNGDTTPILNGGDFIIGSLFDGFAGVFAGQIEGFFCGTDDLSEAEEDDLSKGIPPSDTVNAYLLDEGRGVTAYDRGSGGNNGTLDSACTWAFGQVNQPILSLDGINDRGQSSAGVDISGALTLAIVVKAKSTYDGLAADHYLAHLFANASNELRIYYDNAADVLRFHAEGGGTAQTVDYSTKPAIDDYLILILTLTSGGVLTAFVNGSPIGTATGVGALAGVATAYLGAEQTPSLYDISKPLFVALVDGAFTEKQALAYSRYLKNVFNLPITI